MTAVHADVTPAGLIRLEGDTGAGLWARKIPGAKIGQGGCWMLPATLDTCMELRRHSVAFSEALENCEAKADKVRRYIDSVKRSAHAEPLKPIPIKAPYALYQHQVKAYNIALALRGAALLMDMGTGKTLTTVAVTGRRFLDGKIKRVLIIAPTSVCAVWPQEYQKFGDFPVRVALLLGDHATRVRQLKWLCAPTPSRAEEPLRVAVINYESAWRLKDGKTDHLQDFHADMVVCDESQRIKSPSAKQSKAVWKLGDLARYRIILSGTPIQKDTRDIWSQYRFLDPTVFPISYGSFQARYAIMGGFEGRQYIGARNVEELTRKTHACGFRIKKEECLDLPPKTFEDYPVELDPKTRQLYRTLQKQSIAELESGGEVTANHVLVRMLRLQQLTGGFLVDDKGERHQVNTAKLDALRDIVETLVLDEGKKLIIFSRFLAELDAIQAMAEPMLRKERLSLVRIDGSVKAKERGAIVQRFQGDPACRVFLGELDACAEGLTLTAAQTVVYYSVNWNYAKYQQSADRVHRIGQTGTCTYIHLVAPGTIDDKIMKALKDKGDLAKSVVDNWRSILSEEDGTNG